ncbi:MAG TPA: aminotransferase class III-fold pyridoxal phosphate-dependent enzyme [Thermomicrobiales bacterium]|nr:aminotransferase class III-fold pyridoxal phosphate-dependent enzyme [Thermomicrobiales bacterium]
MSGYERSRELLARARKSLAGGVSSDVRVSMKPFPLYFERGEGALLYDADGNAYIDYALGQGPLILGHSPPAVLEAVDEAMRRGQIFAGQHELEIEAAEAVVELVPCAGLVRFSLSGSEAVHAAVRLARAGTGRTKLLRFEGHYHGWFDGVLVGPDDDGGAAPLSQGQSPGAVGEVIVLPWNDLDALESAFARHGEELAAVIMEPVMCNTAVVPPGDGYLEGVRAYCDRYGALLILDEVITGFRLAPGGAQERFGVTADLATYGKALAGGFPNSAVAGRADLMERLGQSVNHSGTFNSNVISMAATVATLRELTRDDNAAYRKIERAGTALMDGLREIGARLGIPLLIQGFPPAFYLGFTEAESFENAADYAARADVERYGRFAVAMLERGVRVLERGLWYVSAAHDDEHVARTLEAAEDALRQVFNA